MEDWKFCPRCGETLEKRGEGLDRHVACVNCGYVKYDNPLPATIACVHDGDRLLLLRRANEPQRGLWDTVGGFLVSGERAEDCVRREAREEIGCELADISMIGTYDSVYGNTNLHTIGIAFLCRLENPDALRLSEENDEYRWFSASETPEIAFRDVESAVRDAFRLLSRA